MCKQSNEEVNEVSRPKIQGVPEYMGSRAEFKKYYLPQLISIGPAHYGKPELGQGEQYKSAWTDRKHANQAVKDIHHRISSHLGELRGQMDEEHYALIENWKYEFLLGLLLDGCSVLHVLEKSDNSVDPEQELMISIDKLVRVHQDLLVLENQIPFKVLRLLCNDEARLQKCLDNFLEIHGIETNRSTDVGQGAEQHKVTVHAEEPVHLLDYLRRALLTKDLGIMPVLIEIRSLIMIERRSLHLRKYRIGTIRELKAAGIRVRKYPNSNSFTPSFDSGILQLPELTVDGSTALIFLNLIAYEMCPDFRNNFEVSSFLVFMSSLIDQPEDVKELRSAEMLREEGKIKGELPNFSI